jgi:hypothetical protein
MATAAEGYRFDLDLSERDVQALSSADELVALLARMGYDTNARTVQTPGNLGIAAEATLRPIRRIELAADQDGLFQVYIFELTSVTVMHTRALARAFRNRAGNFLLVLTSDWERLDFVLLERFLPPAPDSGSIGEKHVGIRPRVLSVDRRNPGRRAVRVLKRLTWTETDGFAQHEKLIAAYAVADWAEEHFNNRALFSDYYLLERLREFPEWSENPKPAYLVLRELYLDAARFAGKHVNEMVHDLVEPALLALGFDPRASDSSITHDAPNFALYAPGGSEPLAFLIAYPWGRSLDGKDDTRDSQTPHENPGAVVVSLLDKSDAQWVVVTNGRLWRLYARQAHSRATNYYELDAEEVLSDTAAVVSDASEAFRYFWLLFRRQAFERRATQRDGKSLELSRLDRLLLESDDYAKELGTRLKDRVFEEIFPHLGRGFVGDLRARTGKRAVDQDALNEIYLGTLTFLYRILFLLYAEARDLLPVREVRGYWEVSLKRLKEDIAERAGPIRDEVDARLKKVYRDDAHTLWSRLSRLFAVVDKGDPSLNVPLYDGGLFLTSPADEDISPEAQAARFLADHRICDRDLALAIDLLARSEDAKKHSLVPIDYKSLGVRQLGSIYEGLLEFRLCVAREQLAIVSEKGREKYAVFAELDARAQKRAEENDRLVSKGAVYLENDKRERKATGSYYTPDHIVGYIVENAVGPALEIKFAAMRPKLRAAQAERKAFFERQKGLRKHGDSEASGKPDLIGEELVEQLFDVKVLDPAMGSGHFLVEAVDYITDRMLTFLNAFPWNPIQVHLRRTRETILAEAEQQGLTLDPGRLTDVNLLKRHVLKRCICGVDLNPMAVELAKVSLWLDCFTLGAPLSFLDHHLRCGNSLIGTVEEQFEESQQRWGQMDLLGGSQYAGAKVAVGAMIRVSRLADITPQQIGESRRQYRMAAAALAPIRRLFDVYTSQWFGNEPRKVGRGQKAREINPALDFLRDPLCEQWSRNPVQTKLPEHFRKVADTAANAAAQRRFFHWELEFPEVYFGTPPGAPQSLERLKTAGFDAVIGNPPYDVLAEEELGYDISSEVGFFGADSAYLPAMRGKRNLYKLFVCRGRQVAAANGTLSFIVPMAILGDDQTAGVRRFLLLENHMLAVEAFPQKDDQRNRVFAEAKLSTALFVCGPSSGDKPFVVRTHSGREIESASASVLLTTADILRFDKDNAPILTCSQRDWEIASRIVASPRVRRLGDFCRAYQGEVNETTDGKRGLVSYDTKDGPLILRGANICLYTLRDASQGEPIYLREKKFLTEKSDSARVLHHKHRRIGWQESSAQNNFRRIIAAPIPAGQYCNHKINYLTAAELTLDFDLVLALLNSRICDWFFRLTSTSASVSHYQIEKLPAPTVVSADDMADWRDAVARREWKALASRLVNACAVTGEMPRAVASAIVALSRRIQKIEGARVLTNRGDRSHLDSESTPIQEAIDAVLFRCFGLSEEESHYVSGRVDEML